MDTIIRSVVGTALVLIITVGNSNWAQAAFKIPACWQFADYAERTPTQEGLSNLQYWDDRATIEYFGLKLVELTDDQIRLLLTTAEKCDPSFRGNAGAGAVARIKELKARRDQARVDLRDGATFIKNYTIQYRSFSNEVDALPNNTQSYGRLDEIERTIASGPRRTGSTATYSGQDWNEIVAMRDALHNKIADKRQEIVKAGNVQMKLAYVAKATSSAMLYEAEINRLGFPAGYLNATIYLDSWAAQNYKFVPLRLLIGVLISLDRGKLSGVRFKESYGLAIKAPGARTVIYGFKLDGDELFLSHYLDGDAGGLLLDDREKAVASTQLKRLAEWSDTWDSLAAVSTPIAKTKDKASVQTELPKSELFLRPNPILTPDEIAKELDRQRTERRR